MEALRTGSECLLYLYNIWKHSNSRPSSQWCHPAISSSVVPFSSCPQSLPASETFPMSQLFAWGGQSISFSFNISPSNEHPGLISFRMDWLDFLAVQGTLKSLLQHHSSKASVLRRSAFFMVHLSHPYVTTGKRNRSFKLLLECHLLSAAHPDDLPVCSCILLLPGTSCSLILLCLLFFYNIYHPPRRSLIYLFFPVCCIACFFPPLLVFSPSRM